MGLLRCLGRRGGFLARCLYLGDVLWHGCLLPTRFSTPLEAEVGLYTDTRGTTWPQQIHPSWAAGPSCKMLGPSWPQLVPSPHVWAGKGQWRRREHSLGQAGREDGAGAAGLARGAGWRALHLAAPQGPSGRVAPRRQGVREPPTTKMPWLQFPWVLSSCITLHQWPQIWTGCVSLGFNRKREEGRRKQAVTV